MNAIIILLAGIVVLIAAYVTYGKWLAEQWGIDPAKKTPSHELADGMDLSGKGACADGASFFLHRRRGADQRADPGGGVRMGAGAFVGSDRRYLLWSGA